MPLDEQRNALCEKLLIGINNLAETVISNEMPYLFSLIEEHFDALKGKTFVLNWHLDPATLAVIYVLLRLGARVFLTVTTEDELGLTIDAKSLALVLKLAEEYSDFIIYIPAQKLAEFLPPVDIDGVFECGGGTVYYKPPFYLRKTTKPIQIYDLTPPAKPGIYDWLLQNTLHKVNSMGLSKTAKSMECFTGTGVSFYRVMNIMILKIIDFYLHELIQTVEKKQQSVLGDEFSSIDTLMQALGNELAGMLEDSTPKNKDDREDSTIMERKFIVIEFLTNIEDNSHTIKTAEILKKLCDNCIDSFNESIRTEHSEFLTNITNTLIQSYEKNNNNLKAALAKAYATYFPISQLEFSRRNRKRKLFANKIKENIKITKDSALFGYTGKTLAKLAPPIGSRLLNTLPEYLKETMNQRTSDNSKDDLVQLKQCLQELDNTIVSMINQISKAKNMGNNINIRYLLGLVSMSLRKLKMVFIGGAGVVGTPCIYYLPLQENNITVIDPSQEALTLVRSRFPGLHIFNPSDKQFIFSCNAIIEADIIVNCAPFSHTIPMFYHITEEMLQGGVLLNMAQPINLHRNNKGILTDSGVVMKGGAANFGILERPTGYRGLGFVFATIVLWMLDNCNTKSTSTPNETNAIKILDQQTSLRYFGKAIPFHPEIRKILNFLKFGDPNKIRQYWKEFENRRLSFW
ncbi:MAG: hypothetical protein AAGI07_19785, partial [Bacteroidota bacterium]